MKQSPRARAFSQNEQLCDLLIMHNTELIRSVENSQSHNSGQHTFKTTDLTQCSKMDEGTVLFFQLRNTAK